MTDQRRSVSTDGQGDRGDGARQDAGGDRRERGDKDWEWRRRIRSNPHSHRIYKWVVGVVGAVVTGVGLIAVPAPGPGWLIVFLGVGILASEFEWAQRVLDWGRARLDDWNDWLRPKPWWFKGLVGLATAVLVGLLFYGLFLLSGVPTFVPDVVEDWLNGLPGV